MQLFPGSIDSKLGFNRIRELTSEACASELGERYVANLKTLSDYHQICEDLTATAELKVQIDSGEAFPEINAFRLTTELQRSSVLGYQIPSEQLFELKLNLDIASGSRKYFSRQRDTFPWWESRSAGIEIPETLIKRLDQVFDKDGQIRDSASPELKRIRQEINSRERRARKELDSLLKFAGEKGYSDSESQLTIRDGRLVLPILAEHKKRIKGLVVDESTTGKTVYLEPLQVFESNNEIRELKFAEKREITAILTALTALVSEVKNQLLEIETYLSVLDFTRAKARVAVRLGACLPQVTDTGDIKLVNAYHPLLQLSHTETGAPVIPLNLELSQQQGVMVISGPNAGGKSVALKTVGLLQLMIQSGMLVPVAESSSLGCFNEIFVDIGDEQSIESDLSTYSSHLANMKHLLKSSTSRSLFLIDEFGTGTEPQFGGAIAESILHALVQKQARGLVTTHYGNLKKFAEQTAGVVNAAMRFDLETLSPEYVLDVGRPGSSFALEIARKMGLPEDILKMAREKIGHDPVAFEKLVSELEQEKQQLERLNRDNRQLRNSLEQERNDYQARYRELKIKQKEIINNARMEAKSLLDEANQRIEATIRSIKESKAQKEVTHKVRIELGDFKKKIKPVKRAIPTKIKVVPGPVSPGDLVQIKESNAQGEVLKVSGKSAEILIGSLKSKVALDRLQKVGKSQPPPTARKGRSNIDLQQKRATYSTQLDVRGLRAGEALDAVTAFVDEGVLLGMNDLRILHGKGDGILRSAIRKHLQDDSSVKSIKDEHVERGGSGVTLVTLK